MGDFVNVRAEKPHIRLKVLMAALGADGVDLVQVTGLSHSLVRKIMCGVRLPSPSTAQQIESFFNRRIFSTPEEWRERQRRRARASKKGKNQ